MKRPLSTKVLAVCLLTVIVFFAIHVRYSRQLSAQLYSFREVLNRVFDAENGRLMTTPGLTAQTVKYSETEIINFVYDLENNLLRTSSGTPEEGTGVFSDLTTGTNTSATMTVGTGASLVPSGSGVILSSSALIAEDALVGCIIGTYAHNYLAQDWSFDCKQVLFSELGGTATDAQIPHLGTLSTGLTVGKCMQVGADGTPEAAVDACGPGVGGAGTWGDITGTLADQTDLQVALDAKEDALGYVPVPDTRTVCGDPLSSDVLCTKEDVDLANVDNKSSETLHTEVRTESGALNIPRTHVQIDESPIVIDPLYQRIVIAELSQATTFGVPTGTTPVDGQILEIDVFSTVTRLTTFLTDANGFCTGHNIPLPTGTLGGKWAKWAFTWLDAIDCWSFFGTTQTAYSERYITRECINDDVTVTTGDGKCYVPIPSNINGWKVTGVHANVGSAVSSSGAVNTDVDICGAVATGIRCSGSNRDLLSTNITIDVNEDGTETAAVAAVVDTDNDNVATGEWFRVNVDSAGTGVKGLYITLVLQTP